MATKPIKRQQTTIKALVRAIEPRKPKIVTYRFSNGRTFKETDK